jgi:hypothetical protein
MQGTHKRADRGCCANTVAVSFRKLALDKRMVVDNQAALAEGFAVLSSVVVAAIAWLLAEQRLVQRKTWFAVHVGASPPAAGSHARDISHPATTRKRKKRTETAAVCGDDVAIGFYACLLVLVHVTCTYTCTRTTYVT